MRCQFVISQTLNSGDPLLVNDIRHIKHYVQEKVSHNSVL